MNKDYLFEIHVSVDSKELGLLTEYCKERKYKMCIAVSTTGEYPIQGMITKWKRGSVREGIEKGLEITQDMTNYGLRVVRTKVEMDAEKSESIGSSEIKYYEFHLKVPCESDSLPYLKGVVNLRQASISYNIVKDQEPIVTLRVKGSLNQAIELKNSLVSSLKDTFELTREMHSEACVFDTFPEMDDGWLKTVFMEQFN